MSRYEKKEDKGYWLTLIIVVLVLLVVGAAVMFLKSQQQEESVTGIKIPKENIVLDTIDTEESLGLGVIEGSRKTEEYQNEQLLEETVALPPLVNSDAIFKSEVAKVSGNLSAWFGDKAVIEKYIILINDLSQNQMLFKHRAFLKQPGKMLVGEDADGLYLTNESYSRFDNFANAIAAIEVDKGLQLYLKFKPLFKQVYEEFAYPADYRLEDIFLKAAANVIESPVIEERIELVQHSVRYKFADKKLESLTPINKQMIRMGPKNTRKIQNKLRQLAEKIAVLSE